MVKNILGKLFSIWGALMFIGPMLIVLIPAWAIGLIKEPKRTDWFIKICRFWMDLFYPLAGIRLDIKGKEHFEKNKNYIVACNHNSLIDVTITSPRIPGANKTIAKIEMSKIPLFGIIYKRGSILLDRKSETSRKESYQQMKWVLDLGMHMCIYPEGTRNKTNDPLKSFHDGAFRLSFETGKAIIPAVIQGTKEMLPSDKAFFFWPGKVHMKFLPPVEPTQFNHYTEMKQYVFELMWEEALK